MPMPTLHTPPEWGCGHSSAMSCTSRPTTSGASSKEGFTWGFTALGGDPGAAVAFIQSGILFPPLGELSWQFLLISRRKLCFHSGTAREHRRAAAGAT